MLYPLLVVAGFGRSVQAAESTAPTPGAPSAPDAGKDFLVSREITAVVAPHLSEIKRCYLEAAVPSEPRGSARLELRFVIGREGWVRSVSATVPGLPAKPTHKLAACMREILADVRFPARRNETLAVVPYFFQKTVAPNAGPQLGSTRTRS